MSLRLPHCGEPPARREAACAPGSRLRAGEPLPWGANEHTYGAQRQTSVQIEQNQAPLSVMAWMFVSALVAIVLSSQALRRHAYICKGADL